MASLLIFYISVHVVTAPQLGNNDGRPKFTMKASGPVRHRTTLLGVARPRTSPTVHHPTGLYESLAILITTRDVKVQCWFDTPRSHFMNTSMRSHCSSSRRVQGAYSKGSYNTLQSNCMSVSQRSRQRTFGESILENMSWSSVV